MINTTTLFNYQSSRKILDQQQNKAYNSPYSKKGLQQQKMSDLTLDAKQQFLYDEIVMQGYNADDFAEFINKESKHGMNIEYTTFTELQRIVQKYKQTHNSINQISSNQSQYDFNSHSETANHNGSTSNENKSLDPFDSSHYEQKYTKKFRENTLGIKDEKLNTQSKEEKQEGKSKEQCVSNDGNKQHEQQTLSAKEESQLIVISKYGLSEAPYFREIDCLKEIPMINFYSKVVIDVCEPEKVQGGLFGFTAGYLTYKIVVKPHNWEVRRKNSDFNMIREILQRIYPGKILPPLKNKRNISSDKYGIEKQMRYLQMFLEDLNRDDEIWANEYLISFLSERNPDKLLKKFKEAEKIQLQRSFKTHSNMEGKIKVQLTNSNYLFAEESTKFVDNASSIYTKIKNLCRTLKQDFEKTSETMFSLGELFHQLFSHFNDFDNKIIEKKQENQKLKDCYVNLNNLMMTWGNLMQNQVKQVHENMCFLFKYGEKEMEQYKFSLKQLAEEESSYFKYKQRLNAKKEKLFSLGDISKWEIGPNIHFQPDNIINNKQLAFKIMCTKETIYENHLKDYFAFYCESIYQNLSKGFQKKANDYSKFFEQFSQSQLKNIEEISNLWKEIQNQYKLDDVIHQGTSASQKSSTSVNEKQEILKHIFPPKFY
ncbi:PX-SNX-like domain protein (macronuclear) [Tetrahymena thermophila SB210]|uniref:PX-SNX-like domain protein n=1 Tax=Tetrahymena thermophila (strain SB210) TaxID=312017 RepID=Q23AR3_TETTS|nr:PX-SNX-like domain protein [Tetrahymena thermophila SB210]EAR93629.2 PX-SNX-like domain protein [Tetrahymena thermophila SB210]|eukprot:XP_001013874.2 PX-SNX-like domain protein [Tetrahymena thermophila SB210]